MKSKVALLKVDPATGDNIHSSLRNGLSDVINFDALLNAKKIIIKVNLCKPFPADSGATVDIRITENLVKLILERNPNTEIFVVESNSGSRYAEKAFEETEYLQLQDRYKKLHIINLSRTSQTIITDKRFRYFKKGLRLSSLFLDCDYFISIAKLKTHEFERFTGILKNQFGCISTKNKPKMHPYLPDVISDVNSVLRPDLCIIDGIIAMEGSGPSFGDPKELNLMIMGNDPVATDVVAATVMGIDPSKVPHLKTAVNRGLGDLDISKTLLIGEKIEKVKTNFKFIPPRALTFHRMSLKFHKFANSLSTVTNAISSTAQQSERLARALYRRSFTEIFTRRILPRLTKKLKIPTFLHKFLLLVYLKIS